MIFCYVSNRIVEVLVGENIASKKINVHLVSASII